MSTQARINEASEMYNTSPLLLLFLIWLLFDVNDMRIGNLRLDLGTVWEHLEPLQMND